MGFGLKAFQVHVCNSATNKVVENCRDSHLHIFFLFDIIIRVTDLLYFCGIRFM